MTRLSRREREILELAADGLTNAETGVRLHIATATVKRHKEQLLHRLGARNIGQAIAIAFRAGLLT